MCWNERQGFLVRSCEQSMEIPLPAIINFDRENVIFICWRNLRFISSVELLSELRDRHCLARPMYCTETFRRNLNISPQFKEKNLSFFEFNFNFVSGEMKNLVSYWRFIVALIIPVVLLPLTVVFQTNVNVRGFQTIDRMLPRLWLTLHAKQNCLSYGRW
jgi:hypothetical protein